MRFLHAGFTVALVIEHHDGEVARALCTDGGETPQAHQHLAIPGDDEHSALGLRERKAQTDHARRPHRTPQREGERMVPRGRAIPRCRSEPGDDQQRAAPLEERADHFAAIELCAGQGLSPKDFAPIMR